MIHREDILQLLYFAINFMKIDLFGLSHLIYDGQESIQIFLILYQENNFTKKI